MGSPAFRPHWLATPPSQMSINDLMVFKVWLDENWPLMPDSDRHNAKPFKRAVVAEIRSRNAARNARKKVRYMANKAARDQCLTSPREVEQT